MRASKIGEASVKEARGERESDRERERETEWYQIVRKRIASRYIRTISCGTARILGSSEFLKRVTREWVFNQGIPDNRSPRELPPPS